GDGAGKREGLALERKGTASRTSRHRLVSLRSDRRRASLWVPFPRGTRVAEARTSRRRRRADGGARARVRRLGPWPFVGLVDGRDSSSGPLAPRRVTVRVRHLGEARLDEKEPRRAGCVT